MKFIKNIIRYRKTVFSHFHKSYLCKKFLNYLDPHNTNWRCFCFLLKKDIDEQHEKKNICVVYQNEIKDIYKDNELKKNVKIINNNICEINEKLLKENLNQYNLFNVYLDKIKKKEKKKKIINLNSVKYFDDYIYLFNLESLLVYTYNKFKIFKKKKSMTNNDFYYFFKIFIQFNVILNDFFYYKNEKKCNECFISTFQPYLKNVSLIRKIEKTFDENFYLKILQIIKIYNQINFFNKLKNTNFQILLNRLNISDRQKHSLRMKTPQKEFSDKDENHLFYECMSYNEKDYIYNNDLDFIKNLKIFDKIYEIKSIENYLYCKDEDSKKNKNSCVSLDKIYYYNNKIENPDFSNNKVNKNNELINDKIACEEGIDENINHYLNLVKGFSYLLKNFIKYLNDDGMARLFMNCSKMFDKKDTNEVSLFYKEMYEKIKKMKNITNKNLAYILNGCNYYLKEENFYLIKHLKNDLLNNFRRNDKKSNFNIYNITPSHLENIVFTFSKNNIKDEKLFLLFTEIIKEKYEGFSCIISINILNSFSLLNYEMLIFDFLYEKIKSFDFITFMMCKGNNIIKLIKTLLQIESRNFLKKENSNIILKKSKMHNITLSNNNINEKYIGENTIEKDNQTLTEEYIYINLIIALLYEHKTFKRNSLNENIILDIYKKLLRLHIIKVKNKKDLNILKNIFKKNYKTFCIKEFDKYFVFSFISLNFNKINFHKLIFALLKYNNLICEKKSTNNYKEKKKKFI
ncbi:conserved Plasmodium protein, unknown function [Plasmodium gallinaceum]|uniref:Uncharacterized protein n=1 Tax=Plasmodium gallinaceum TaxID=5849 RepID=A0A1J1GU45_PLAGA|nr:conserved Plasmodium protein, unknown function [Plasmodium gallinaceum]CRG94838.1 conserved Plasmodium protein, unknown function [Plasmodium gallinaceum]